jgi:hypothetical protein
VQPKLFDGHKDRSGLMSSIKRIQLSHQTSVDITELGCRVCEIFGEYNLEETELEIFNLQEDISDVGCVKFSESIILKKEN